MALLLLAAAGLKVYGFDEVTPSPLDVALFSTSTFSAAVIIWETLLAFWLLSGRHRVGGWLAAAVTFAVFAAVSAWAGWQGRPSCGCLGAVTVSPWVMLGVDLVAVAALAVSWPRWGGWPARAEVRATAAGAGLAAGFAGLVLVAVVAPFGSVAATRAYIRGDAVFVRPDPVDVGSGSPGEEREGWVEVTNITEEPIQLIGGESGCACLVTGSLPAWVPADGSIRIPVRVRLPERPGPFRRSASVMTDRAGTLSFAISGRVTAP